MAHTKSGGAVKGNKDSHGKCLGVKLYAGQQANPGNIIVRQRGTKINPGAGTDMGKDYTIFAINPGKVNFGIRRGRKFVQVV